MKNSEKIVAKIPLTIAPNALSLILTLGYVLSFSLITGCSRASPAKPIQQSWLMSGSITLSNPIPEIKSSERTTAFGFSAQSASHPGPWLLINRNERLVQLMEGERVVQSASGRGIENLTPGVFQLLHKQRSPLWYAPDSYFAARQLKIPPQGDRSRLLRGALGEFALFLNKETPLHSGPVWSQEIGGIQLEDNALSKIYYTLPIGAPIEVR